MSEKQKDIQFYLDKFNMQVNPDAQVAEAIRKRVVKCNGYCPCVPERNDDTVCPCKKMREEGHCCCTLYVAKAQSIFMNRAEKAKELFLKGYNCSQSVFAAFADKYGLTEEMALRLAGAFGAGFGGTREVCGAVSGITLACGLEYGAVTPDQESKKRCYLEEQKLIEKFKALHGTIICRERLKIGNSKEFPMASERTAEYYAKRPCLKIVMDAAQIISDEFGE